MARTLYLTAIVVLTSFAIAGASTANAAGSSGGGMGSGTYKEDRLPNDPERLSEEAFELGVKHRDRALKALQKAANTSSERRRESSQAKANKHFFKAIENQGEAIRLFPRNYKAANELGFAYRKTGNYRKAIGAYNYALQINPDFHQATEYRGEAYLALGMYDLTQQSYMLLFREDRGLAQQLMDRIEHWREAKPDLSSPARDDFLSWVEERKRVAKITADLSQNNTRAW